MKEKKKKIISTFKKEKECDFVKVDKKVYNELVTFLKDCAMEGNGGAVMILKKYKENL